MIILFFFLRLAGGKSEWRILFLLVRVPVRWWLPRGNLHQVVVMVNHMVHYWLMYPLKQWNTRSLCIGQSWCRSQCQCRLARHITAPITWTNTTIDDDDSGNCVCGQSSDWISTKLSSMPIEYIEQTASRDIDWMWPQNCVWFVVQLIQVQSIRWVLSVVAERVCADHCNGWLVMEANHVSRRGLLHFVFSTGSTMLNGFVRNKGTCHWP